MNEKQEQGSIAFFYDVGLKNMRALPFSALLILFSSFSFAEKPLNMRESVMSYPYLSTDFAKTCVNDPGIQKRRSFELEKLVNADQADRDDLDFSDHDSWIKLSNKDLKRRKRVGALFGEGCIQSGEDYAAAALIYIHGLVPDHYYQSYLWAKKANDTGNERGFMVLPMAIDRYLISINKKQLFGTQAQALEDGCFCTPSVEASFPDSLREKFKTPTTEQRLEMLAEMNEGKYCPEPECTIPLDDSPKGTVPGFW